MAEFKIGDTVRLKSGGPLMTVINLPNQHIRGFMCQWFEGDTPRKGSFPGDALEAE